MRYTAEEYWDRRIEEWESSAYLLGDVRPSIHELVATLFRADAVKERLKVAMRLLKPIVPSRTVLDLGCGGGNPSLALLKHGAEKVIGIDMSGKALNMAEGRAKALNLADRLVLIQGDVRTMELPATDITVSLGLLDYLEPKEVRNLVFHLKSPIVLVSFTRQSPKLSLALQKLYHKALCCPRLYFHTPTNIADFLLERGYSGIRVSTHKLMKLGTIVHNIQKREEKSRARSKSQLTENMA